VSEDGEGHGYSVYALSSTSSRNNYMSSLNDVIGGICDMHGEKVIACTIFFYEISLESPTRNI
jgi:hypothetical protein